MNYISIKFALAGFKNITALWNVEMERSFRRAKMLM